MIKYAIMYGRFASSETGLKTALLRQVQQQLHEEWQNVKQGALKSL